MGASGKIYFLGCDPVISFAAAELAHYLQQMSGTNYVVVQAEEYRTGVDGWWLGLAEEFSLTVPAEESDDGIVVSSTAQRVILGGVNGRSVLFAVYRYLEELGCCWLRPGRDGERVPQLNEPLRDEVNLVEVPDVRYRCICIEGSCSAQHVIDLIDYAAKRGFNAYFFQFRSSYAFYERWYGLERNRKSVRLPFSYDNASACQQEGKRAAQRRGLDLHVMGHGWTSEPLGLLGEEWRAVGQEVPAESVPLLAE